MKSFIAFLDEIIAQFEAELALDAQIEESANEWQDIWADIARYDGRY